MPAGLLIVTQKMPVIAHYINAVDIGGTAPGDDSALNIIVLEDCLFGRDIAEIICQR